MFETEKQLFKALDDFIYKSKGVDTELRNKLISKVREFINENGLDTDPHNFIDLTKIPE